MIGELRSVLSGFRRSARLFGTYLILTQLLLWLVLYPAFWWLARRLFAWGGIVALNNANAGAFLATWPGVAFLGLAMLVLLVTVLLEGGGFVKLSAVVLRLKVEPSSLAVWREIAHSLRRIIGPGLLVVVFLGLVVFPLTGSALKAGFLGQLRVPNFVMAVISASPGLHAAYWVLIVVLHGVMFILSFLFQFMLLARLRFWAAVKASFRLVTANFFRLLGFMALAQVVLLVASLALLAAVVGLLMAVLLPESFFQLFIGSFLVLLLACGCALLFALAVPLQLYLITSRYYAYLADLPATDPLSAFRDDFPKLAAKTRPSLLDRMLKAKRLVASVLLLGLLATSLGFATWSKEFTQQPVIAAVGHRGGPGDQAIENTLQAVELSIAAGAKYVEVDVQRTKDGHYVIFHDDNFARFTHEKRRVQDLTLAEIQALDLGEKSGTSGIRVPTLAQMIEATRGRIGLFLELKGASADRQMVDDCVTALTAAAMLDQTVLMSLNYGVIEYVEQAYPHVTSGFTYVVSLGETQQLTGDYLILEEDAASWELIDEIHDAGKRVAVWTVNDDLSMSKFVNWSIDAVITDYVDRWQVVVKEREQEHPLIVLMGQLLG